jgi:hypothetical protein
MFGPATKESLNCVAMALLTFDDLPVFIFVLEYME